MSLKAGDLEQMLRTHYAGTPSKPAAGYFVSELQAPDSTRRADGLWLPLDGYNRGRIIGHEIKVSRSDVVAELADPMKSHAWSKFCNEWWLVISDASIIAGLTLPDHWGVMLPPSFNSRSKRLMMIVRPAEKLKPVDQDKALGTVMARMFYNGDDQQTKLRYLKNQHETDLKHQARQRDQIREMQQELRRSGLVVSEYEKQARDEATAIINAIRVPKRDHYDSDDWETYAALRSMPIEDIVSVLTDRATFEATTRTKAAVQVRRLENIERELRALDVGPLITRLKKILEDPADVVE